MKKKYNSELVKTQCNVKQANVMEEENPEEQANMMEEENPEEQKPLESDTDFVLE